MTEILRTTRISLLAYGIVCVLYGVLAIFFTSMMEAMLGPMEPSQRRWRSAEERRDCKMPEKLGGRKNEAIL